MFIKDEKLLSSLKPGQSGFVSSIESFPNDNSKRELRFKILTLGLVPGTEVEVKSIAPFGDPITIEVRGTLISLRKSEASIIKISSIESAKELQSNFAEVVTSENIEVVDTL
jgi:Fe2+ transport system protein FeoA